MSQLGDFLRIVLSEARAELQDRSLPLDLHDKDALSLLQRAYDDFQLEIAGPAIAFEPKTALVAATLLHNACWFLLNRGETDSVLKEVLAMPEASEAPAAHLSADLTLRFVPQIYQRAIAIDPADTLPIVLADILRRWPLSGVLANLEEGPRKKGDRHQLCEAPSGPFRQLVPVPFFPPLSSLDFGGHPGLLMLYAERLAQHEKPAWVPSTARGLEYAELVYEELGNDLTALHLVVETLAKRVRPDE